MRERRVASPETFASVTTNYVKVLAIHFDDLVGRAHIFDTGVEAHSESIAWGLEMDNFLFDHIAHELLERRLVLDGNVSVAAVGGDLVVNGDDDGNELIIRATAEAGTYFVEGVNGTTINGELNVLVSGITDDFRINLRDGNNVLMLTARGTDVTHPELVVPDDLQIRATDGADVLVMDLVRVAGNSTINLGAGDDGIVIVYCNLEGALRVNTGAGNDLVGLQNSTVGGVMRSNSGTEVDHVVFFTCTMESSVHLNLGAGDDYAGYVSVNISLDLNVQGNRGENDTSLENSLVVSGNREERLVEVSQAAAPEAVAAPIQNIPSLGVARSWFILYGTGI